MWKFSIFFCFVPFQTEDGHFCKICAFHTGDTHLAWKKSLGPQIQLWVLPQNSSKLYVFAKSVNSAWLNCILIYKYVLLFKENWPIITSLILQGFCPERAVCRGTLRLCLMPGISVVHGKLVHISVAVFVLHFTCFTQATCMVFWMKDFPQSFRKMIHRWPPNIFSSLISPQHFQVTLYYNLT